VTDPRVLQDRLDRIATYLDDWEASYGFGGRDLPRHWGITEHIENLRTLLGPKEGSP